MRIESGAVIVFMLKRGDYYTIVIHAASQPQPTAAVSISISRSWPQSQYPVKYRSEVMGLHDDDGLTSHPLAHQRYPVRLTALDVIQMSVTERACAHLGIGSDINAYR